MVMKTKNYVRKLRPKNGTSKRNSTSAFFAYVVYLFFHFLKTRKLEVFLQVTTENLANTLRPASRLFVQSIRRLTREMPPKRKASPAVAKGRGKEKITRHEAGEEKEETSKKSGGGDENSAEQVHFRLILMPK